MSHIGLPTVKRCDKYDILPFFYFEHCYMQKVIISLEWKLFYHAELFVRKPMPLSQECISI